MADEVNSSRTQSKLIMKERLEVRKAQRKGRGLRRSKNKPKVLKSWLKDGLEEAAAEMASWPKWLRNPRFKRPKDQ